MLIGHSRVEPNVITSVFFCPSSKLLISADNNGECKVWNVGDFHKPVSLHCYSYNLIISSMLSRSHYLVHRILSSVSVLAKEVHFSLLLVIILCEFGKNYAFGQIFYLTHYAGQYRLLLS